MNKKIAWTVLLVGGLLSCTHTHSTAETNQVPTSQAADQEAETPGARAQPADPVPGPGAGAAEVSIPKPVKANALTGQEGPLAAARADLAKRLGVAETEIATKAVEAEQWSNAGLGCPQPGMMYAQVLTSGYRVILKVDGQDYFYHTDDKENQVLCELADLPELPNLQITPGEIDDGQPWKPVD